MPISNVLVIEDSEPEQFLCKIIIEKFNPSINVLQAYDGEEALALLNKIDNKPEVIFIDINMPGLDGYQFLEKYEQQYKEEESAFIAMLTSSNQPKDKERAEGYKCVNKYVEKPLTNETLEEISNLLK
jgi:CheY-like chemotaxis protein